MVHFFDSHIAQKYGINAAVLAGFLWDCAEEKKHAVPAASRGQGLGSLLGADDDGVLSVPLLRRNPLCLETADKGACSHKGAFQRKLL